MMASDIIEGLKEVENHEKNRVYAGIDLDALRYNMESMHKNIKEGTKIAAVIKADAYRAWGTDSSKNNRGPSVCMGICRGNCG